jgi:hypothetical protein
MSKIGAWKCDICGTVFMEGSNNFLHKSSVEIKFEEIDETYFRLDEEEEFCFDDVCLNCRTQLIGVIKEYLKSKN